MALKKAAKWMSSILFVLMILVISVVFFMPLIFGSKLLIVYSESMTPTLPLGGMMMMQPVDPTTIKTGDIIAYKLPEERGNIVCHRVVEVLNQSDGILSFHTKGDANEDPDPYTVPAENVAGKIRFCIPFLGYLMHYAQKPLGIVLLLGIPGAVLIGDELRKIIAVIGGRKKEKQAEAKEPIHAIEGEQPEFKQDYDKMLYSFLKLLVKYKLTYL
jgi:signal peptidase